MSRFEKSIARIAALETQSVTFHARRIYKITLILAAALVCCGQSSAQPQSKPVAWPDPLITHDGKPIRNSVEFLTVRRAEILHDFEENVYGRTPTQVLPIQTRVISVDGHALHGAAIRKQIDLTVSSGKLSRTMHLLVYLPSAAKGPVPVFVGLNFSGNQSVSADPGIDLNDVWIPDPALAGVSVSGESAGHVVRKATEDSRGKGAGLWQLEELLHAGYGLATMYAGDIEPDFVAGIGYGVRPLFFREGQSLPAADEWGSIGAWAWGMSRIADYLLTDPAVDAHGLIAFGFSRFGKTALWVGAQDQRFAMVISHESGQGGASLAHREVDEPIAHLNIAFPYWFCANYHHFTGRQQELPVDGHLLLALIAPRPLYVGSAHEDPYSDPEGEFLAARAVGPVYALFGKQGLPADAKYEINHPVGGDLRYYVRPGGHDTLLQDWQEYIRFADERLGLGLAVPSR